MTTVADHADAVIALLRTNTNLTVYDGKVDDGAPNAYVVVYTFRQRPDGLAAPDKIPLTGASTVVEMRMYCHCVGANAGAARIVQGQVEATLLDVTPTVTNRACSPIHLLDGQQAQRSEETGPVLFDQVDVYGFWSVPA